MIFASIGREGVMSVLKTLDGVNADWRTFLNFSDNDIVVRRDAPSVPRRQIESLSGIIEAQIIPRLLLAHNQVRKARPVDEPINFEDVVEFVRLIVAHDHTIALEYVDALRARGTSLESIFVNLFTPAARYLGELWCADTCDFAEVTIATSRMQQLLQKLSQDFIEEGPLKVTKRRALLVALPGDQHTFGLAMLRAFFRKDGWDVVDGGKTCEGVLAKTRVKKLNLVGISVSCDTSIEDLEQFVKSIRAASPNKALRIAVGGRFFLDNPHAVSQVGADMTAVDGRRVTAQFSGLLGAASMR